MVSVQHVNIHVYNKSHHPRVHDGDDVINAVAAKAAAALFGEREKLRDKTKTF